MSTATAHDWRVAIHAHLLFPEVPGDPKGRDVLAQGRRDRDAPLIERLRRSFAQPRRAAIDDAARRGCRLELGVPELRPQDTQLHQQSGFPHLAAPIHASLREPTPQIARRRAQRNADVRERNRIERRENHFVLPEHELKISVLELEIAHSQPRLVENPILRRKSIRLCASRRNPSRTAPRDSTRFRKASRGSA